MPRPSRAAVRRAAIAGGSVAAAAGGVYLLGGLLGSAVCPGWLGPGYFGDAWIWGGCLAWLTAVGAALA